MLRTRRSTCSRLPAPCFPSTTFFLCEIWIFQITQPGSAFSDFAQGAANRESACPIGSGAEACPYGSDRDSISQSKTSRDPGRALWDRRGVDLFYSGNGYPVVFPPAGFDMESSPVVDSDGDGWSGRGTWW